MGRVLRPSTAFARVRESQRQRAAAGERLYRQVRLEVVERDGCRCVFCGETGHEVHHRAARGAGGGRPTNTHKRSRLVLLCRDCHRWVTENPDAAAVFGLVVKRAADCPATPVKRFDEWVLLDDDGGVTPCTERTSR